MKYIPAVLPVPVVDIEGNPVVINGEQEVVTLERFVLARLTDPKFSTSMSNVVAAVSIRDAVKEAKGGAIAIENEHYELLKELVKNPSSNAAYPPGLAHNLVPFMRAVVNEASDKRPEGS